MPRHEGASLAQAPRTWLKAPDVQRVLAALAAAGGEARIAGGAVRNALLGEPVADIDIATTLSPEQVMEIGEKAGFGVHPTGLEHGTVTLTARQAALRGHDACAMMSKPTGGEPRSPSPTTGRRMRAARLHDERALLRRGQEISSILSMVTRIS